MAEYTRDEALAFIEAIRLTLEGKTGFRWLVERLSDLAGYIGSVAAENELLNAFIESVGVKGEYEAYRAKQAETTVPGDSRTDE
jgi:hypothetical protein